MVWALSHGSFHLQIGLPKYTSDLVECPNGQESSAPHRREVPQGDGRGPLPFRSHSRSLCTCALRLEGVTWKLERGKTDGDRECAHHRAFGLAAAVPRGGRGRRAAISYRTDPGHRSYAAWWRR